MVEINEMNTKRTIQRTTETKSWFYEDRNMTDTPLAKLTKRKREDQCK
jgi:hypothetical protein